MYSEQELITALRRRDPDAFTLEQTGKTKAIMEDATRTKLFKLAIICVICIGLVTGLAYFIQSF